MKTHRVLIVIAAMFAGVGLALALATLTQSEQKPFPDERIDGVVRVLMHDTSHYTLLIQRKNSAELQMRSISLWNTAPRFIADAPTGHPMWVFLKGEKTRGMHYLNVDIHIHSSQSVEGAGWDHGKSGRGIIQVIE